jgi:hypothetical protein
MTTQINEVVLPVISANIGSKDGLFKRGNVLLDSGAQISLIRQETASALGLNGKNTSVTITKVGGQEETVKTKAYKVEVTSIDDNKKFMIKAIGIPNTFPRSIPHAFQSYLVYQMQDSIEAKGRLIY